MVRAPNNDNEHLLITTYHPSSRHIPQNVTPLFYQQTQCHYPHFKWRKLKLPEGSNLPTGTQLERRVHS